MKKIFITLAVEDSLSETVARKILSQSDNNYFINNCLCRSGAGYLKAKINDFNKAASTLPFFVLTDQDRGCPPDKIQNWLNHKANPNLIFRIAVMEIESWVMAHRIAFAKFLSIPLNHIPMNTDTVNDPKKLLISLAKKSKLKYLTQDIIPKTGSTATIGPNYNACISNFIRNNWNVHEAINHSESLFRAFKKIQSFDPI